MNTTRTHESVRGPDTWATTSHIIACRSCNTAWPEGAPTACTCDEEAWDVFVPEPEPARPVRPGVQAARRRLQESYYSGSQSFDQREWFLRLDYAAGDIAELLAAVDEKT